MGIQGLLQFIKDASEPINVKKYKGQTVAVDTYCWLHKGAFSCAEKLAKGEPTDQYVSYCMKFVDMLLSFGVKPILVFDGCNLPSKQEVEKARRERRQANLQKGKQLLREGKISEARDCFTRCVNVTPAMAHEVIKAARLRGVDCVVAPYEADAQLAFLNKTGMAQAVITEDSDLLAFGCKKVILKMDRQGNGLEIDQNNLGRCRSLGDVFTEEKFRYMCILSGCDYLPSLYGIGLGKACKLLRVANNPDILKVIRKIGQYLKMNISVPEEYINGFVKANNTFLYQLVFDPINRKVVPLNPYPDDIDPATLSYAGVHVGDSKGLQMALGNLDIHTMERIDDFNPDAPQTRPVKAGRSRSWNEAQEKSACPQGSIWSRGYVPGQTQVTQSSSSPQRAQPSQRKEMVIGLKGLKLPHKEPQVKRPREDPSVSEEDVLQQYSSVVPKRQRAETPHPSQPRVAMAAVNGRPRPRNCFATLLQWRNQTEDEDGDGEQGTRSRFFCSSEDILKQDSSVKKVSSSPPTSSNDLCSVKLDSDPEREETKSTTPTAPPSVTTSPCPANQGLGVFSWSDSSKLISSKQPLPESSRSPKIPSGLSALQQFQRKKETLCWSSSNQKRPQILSSDPSQEGGAEDGGLLPDTPSSQDSAYFSQSNSAPSGLEDIPPSCTQLTGSSPQPAADTEGELDNSVSPTSSPEADAVKSTPMRTKVSGLSRACPGDQNKGGRIKPSAPARASGLRKKPPGSGKNLLSNNENNPGLQATISGLWKNFGFKKEHSKVNPQKKGEPMSPVMDNMQTNVPEPDQDVLLVSG
ncbi:exonuclease 1 [Chanos chanos]|uniref:Exonuclease 1 n=1 Tax=Chanos chanos TaxID=29144 RepID=A0A6J2WJ30_CHACN|nr:exonuclease 1 [Chanos chanos]